MRLSGLRWRRGRGSQGATEVGLAVTVAALVVGALLGTGLAATNVLTSDGLTWLGDDERGTAVQVDPNTGQPQAELKVAQPGDQLAIAQRDGLLVINDTTTGAVTLIDVATLVATGRRSTPVGDATEILLDATQLYLVDRPHGTVHRIDPATAADVGMVWSAGGPLADAALDGTGTVWALGTDGALHALTWSPESGRLNENTPARQVDGAGPRSVLVPHDVGVTVFATEGAVIVQVGTGHDQTLPAPQLDDLVHGAPQAPADLVPAAVTGSASVLIVHGDRVLTVSVGLLGCPKPGDPVVHRGRVYVPCLGSGKVLVFDADGHHQPPDVVVPGGGDPKLVVDDGQLVIHTPGANTGFVIDADGSTRPIRTHDESVPVHDPVEPPKPIQTTNPPRPETNAAPPNGNRNEPGATSTSPAPTSTSASPTPTSLSPSPPGTSSSAPALGPPVNVAATARPDGTVLVTWQPPPVAPTRYHVRRGDDSLEVASVGGGASTAVVTTLAPGDAVALYVEAEYAGSVVPSAPTAMVYPFTGPGSPSGVTIVLLGETSTQLTVDVRWSPAAENGRPVTGYTVTLHSDRGFQQTTTVGGLATGGIAVACGGACNGIRLDASVHATNEGGSGPVDGGVYGYTAPALPVITFMDCEYTGNSSASCSVEFEGVGQITWEVNGSPFPGGDGRSFIRVGCPARGTTPVRVTITNVSGSATRGSGASNCSGPVR